MHIAIVEDDPVIRKELKTLLENAMYQVTVLEEFDRVSEQVEKCQPDLVLLDVTLPGTTGFDICMKIREKLSLPIVFLTSRMDAMDELTGIMKGGDDYIRKPYQTPILLARIGAVLKRYKGSTLQEVTRLEHKGVSLDISKCVLEYRGEELELTKNEMKILHNLFQNAGNFVSRMDLTEYLWESQIFIDDNTLSVYVTRIREKLRSIGIEDFIETKRGMGYRI